VAKDQAQQEGKGTSALLWLPALEYESDCDTRMVATLEIFLETIFTPP
jgi:hypothetical protein